MRLNYWTTAKGSEYFRSIVAGIVYIRIQIRMYSFDWQNCIKIRMKTMEYFVPSLCSTIE
jgi:hypothetical protein